MKLALMFVFLCACGGKPSAPPATPSKPEPTPAPATTTTQLDPLPYIHDCTETGKRCAFDECVAYKVAHKQDKQMAEDECMQDCNCGE